MSLIEHPSPGQPVLASQVDPGPQVVIVQAPAAMAAFPRIRFGQYPVNTVCPNCQNQVSGMAPAKDLEHSIKTF